MRNGCDTKLSKYLPIRNNLNRPGVLPSVSYQDMRLEQSSGVKLLGQCSHIRMDGNQTVRCGCDC